MVICDAPPELNLRGFSHERRINMDENKESTEVILEKAKIEKYLDGISPSDIIKRNSYEAFIWLVRGCFDNLSLSIKEDKRTSCDFVLMTRAGGLFILEGYIKFAGVNGMEKMRISHVFR